MGQWGKVVVVFVAVFVAAGCVFVGVFLAGAGLQKASLWAGVLGLPVAASGVGISVLTMVKRPSRLRTPPDVDLPEWVVPRPTEAEQVIAALLDDRHGTVGITTGLHGAGGFGKTTVARMVCADRKIQRKFRGGVYIVTVGRDIRGADAVVVKVNDVIKLISGEPATYTDPELAGSHLGSLLNVGPRRLLVVDDVWDAQQLMPFTIGGQRCARLVTTRVQGLLAGRGAIIRVDQMSAEQAHRLLTVGLPPLNPLLTRSLLAVTGRWPLLLRLVNKILVNAVTAGGDANAAGELLLQQLRTTGPAVVDDLLGKDGTSLDIQAPIERARAVRATIEASTSLLSPEDGQRFAELCIFAEDESIPFKMVVRLWWATAKQDELRILQLCTRLDDLALVTVVADGPDTAVIMLHDVVREFLRGELGNERLAELNGMLLSTVAEALPSAGTLNFGAPSSEQVAWWELGPSDRYMREHLVWHLLEAGRNNEAEEVAGDLRWVGTQLLRFGAAI